LEEEGEFRRRDKVGGGGGSRSIKGAIGSKLSHTWRKGRRRKTLKLGLHKKRGKRKSSQEKENLSIRGGKV